MKKQLNLVMKQIWQKLVRSGNINNNKPKNKVVFIDADGTILLHRYEITKEGDLSGFLPGSISSLIEMRKAGYYIVLTTGRSKFQCRHFLRYLRDTINFEFDRYLFNLPTGKRIIINDYKVREESKAAAYEVPRNFGISGLNIYEL